MVNGALLTDWVDLTAPLSPTTPVYPGDAPVRFASSFEAGMVTSAASLSLHAGTHMDAPKHAGPGTTPIDAFPHALMLTTLWVMDLKDLNTRPTAPVSCVFVRGVAPRADRPDGGLPLSLYQTMVDAGVRVIGVDAMSVDAMSSSTFPVHHQASRDGVWVIENLRLEGVSPGAYEVLIAPLPLVGMEASPVRVLCRACTTAG